MHVVLISGSHRPAGETHRIAAWFAAQLAAQGHTSHTINLATAGLPMWDEGLWGKGESVATWQRVWQPHSQQLLELPVEVGSFLDQQPPQTSLV